MSRQKRRERFLEFFKKSGWSQAETARQLKVSSNFVNMLIHKEHCAPSEMLLELLRVKVDLIDPRVEKLLETINALPLTHREEATALCSALIDVHLKRAARKQAAVVAPRK